jgi:dihydroneopterin aldolase
MSDRVLIQNLKVATVIGVLDWEREVRQEVLLDLNLEWDQQKAASTDDVRYCLDYAAVSQWVISHLGGAQYHLIETAAEEIAQGLMKAFALPSIEVTVKKPGAIPEAEWVGVSIRRERR